MTMRWAAAAGLLAASGSSAASGPLSWQVKITNVTQGQTFTPILAATHYRNVDTFSGVDSSEVLKLAHYDWNIPVAIVQIRRIHGRR